MLKTSLAGILKHTGVCLGFFICSVSVMAQCTVSGTINDSLNSPFPYSTVGLLKAKDSSIVKGTITGDNGHYSFVNVKPGTYLVKVDIMGYNPCYSSLIMADSLKEAVVPPIIIRNKITNLKEVSATALRPVIEFKGGNIVLNIENSILAQGNSIYDLLEHTPGVVMDGSNISLQGSSQVTILIDDKPLQLPATQLIQLLKGMPSENVERIEVLKNPPAKYDANGSGGFINIVSKKVKVYGFSGLIYGTYSQGIYMSAYGGLSLNYKTKHFTFYGNVNPEYGFDKGPTTLLENFYNAAGNTTLKTYDVNVDLNHVLVAKAGIDWNLDDKTSMGVRMDYEIDNDQSADNSTLSVTGVNNLGFDHNNNTITNPDNNPGYSYIFNAEHKFDTAGSSLSFNATYDNGTDYDQHNTSSYYYAADNTNVLTPFITYYNNAYTLNIYTARLDFRKVLKNSLEIETGIKYKYTGLNSFNQTSFYDSQTGQDTVYNMFTNTFNGSETNEAAYITIIKKTKYLTAGFAMRAENDILAEKSPAYNLDLTRQVFNLFPGVSIEYSKNPNHNFQLTFNHRTDRPDYGQLNPHVSISDQYSYDYGNPYLLPQYSNTAAFTYTFMGFLSNSISYSYITNYISEFQNQDNSNYVSYLGYTNVKTNNIYAYSLSANGDAAKWWSVNINGTASYVTYSGIFNNTVYTTNGFAYSGSIDNEFLLPGKLKLQAFAFFHGPGINGIIESKFWWRMNLFVKKSFCRDKLNVTAGVSDVFYTVRPGSSQNILGSDWNYSVLSDSRRFKISLSYNFGKTHLDASEEEEQPKKEK
ncbi:MAG TPA: TonB-dependent receptor [Bacteroidia bacterium]|jgi:iron complex outermembrane receptor protein|nr:TonB-dependent receptor [Bacteroidia bacterium]